MSKSERLALIRARHAVICAVALPALLPVSKVEIAETVSTESAIALNAERVIIDESEEGFASSLSFDSAKTTSEKEKDILLSASEKAQLEKERIAYRAAHCAQISRFPLVLVA